MSSNVRRFKTALSAFFLMTVTAVTILGVVWGFSLRDARNLAAFQAWIDSLGIGGCFVLFLIQYVQIVAAFIPGGPIQIVAGALYGIPGGLAVCLAGMLSATASIFLLVSRFGGRMVLLFVGERDIEKYSFLNDEARLEKLAAILFFIPGTPKDALTYLFALTKIKSERFILISTVARLPGIMTSLVAGGSIAQGEWKRAFVMFAAMSALAGIGILLRLLFLKGSSHVAKKKNPF